MNRKIKETVIRVGERLTEKDGLTVIPRQQNREKAKLEFVANGEVVKREKVKGKLQIGLRTDRKKERRHGGVWICRNGARTTGFERESGGF